MGALVALIAPKLLPALIPAPIRNALAWAAVIAFVVLTAGIGLKVYNGRLRREGRDQERARIDAVWRQHEDRVVQDVERGRADGPAGARERLRNGATGDGA